MPWPRHAHSSRPTQTVAAAYNMQLAKTMRQVHGSCDEHGDVATTSLLENWIDQAEGRVWFLYEAGRTGGE
jgi:DNA-binding ferritin-like protein